MFGHTDGHPAEEERAEELLRGIDLFSGLDRASIRKLARRTTARDYQPGEVMIREGDPGLGMLILVSGSARVFTERGGGEITLAVLAAGDIVGEMSLIDAQPRSASVRAEEECKCLLLTRDSFHMLSEKEPEILWHIVPQLVHRLRRSDARITELTPRGVPDARGAQETEEEPAGADDTAADAADDAAADAADDAAEETEEADEEELGVVEGMARLMESSAELGSALMLLGVQEYCNLMVGEDPVADRLAASRKVVNSVGERLEDHMRDNARSILEVGRGAMEQLRSMFRQ